MNAPQVFIKQHHDSSSQGPFGIEQIKKLIQQNKIKASAVFSLDQKKWHSASKHLPTLFQKYSGSSAETIKEQPKKTQASTKTKAPIKKATTPKTSIKTAKPSPSKSKTRSSARQQKKSSGGILQIILVLLILAGCGTGFFFHKKISTEMAVQSDRAIQNFSKSLGLVASYELSISYTLDTVILRNVEIKSVDGPIHLKARELENSISVLMTMGWFLTDEVNIEQPQTLTVKASGFEGVFIENGFDYQADLVDLSFFGGFTKEPFVIDGGVQKGKVSLRVDDQTKTNLSRAEGKEGISLPAEGEAYVIEFSGPFQDISIHHASEAWLKIPDLGFRK
jgi:hypothetical protein